MNYNRKRVLITQNNLNKFAGSEVVTLELANFFVDNGAKVTVFTYSLGQPIAEEFSREHKIRVITDPNNSLSFSDFDLVWVHHQVLPTTMLSELTSGCKLPVIVFNHMSSFVPLELPYMAGLEQSVASVILFNSNETRRIQEYCFSDTSQNIMKVYPNPVPKSFINYPHIQNKNTALKKLLIASSHPVNELFIALGKLRARGIEVDIIGELHAPKLMTPKALSKYDAVVTVGKTVPYCLTLGIPAYCYDRFNGPGYLSPSNYAKASSFNFSGRNFNKKTAAIIERELTNQFSDAKSFAKQKRSFAKKEFDIERCLNNALGLVEPRGFVKIIARDVASYISTQQIVGGLVAYFYSADRDIRELLKRIERLDARLTVCEPAMVELEMLKRRKSVRLGLSMSSLLGKLVNLFKP
jgi:hypothetical protein